MHEILQTQRLTLRRLVLSDARNMARLINGADIAQMTASIPSPYTSLCAEFRIMWMHAQWGRGRSYAYAITKTGNDRLIGVMDLFENSQGEKELGYWLGKPYWGEGIVTEAADCVIAEGFKTLDLAHIAAGYFEDNPGSARVLEKLGFKLQSSKNSLYSVARKKHCPTIELRLSRKSAMNTLREAAL